MLRRSDGGRNVRESMRHACEYLNVSELEGKVVIAARNKTRKTHEFGLVYHGGDDVFRRADALVKGAAVQLGPC